MRALIVSLLAGTVLLGGCDKRSAPAPQANAAATSPDEAVAPAVQPGGGAIDRSHKGEAAPTAGFQGPDGKPLTLATFRGKPVLLNLWATWCAPCVKEMPTLDTLAARGGAVQVVAVSQDMQPDKAAPFFARTGVKALKPYRDPDMALSLALGANLPTTILYDATGHELWRTTGDRDWSTAESAKLVGEAG